MLKFLKWFFGLFSPYAHPFERKVDKFFKSIKSTDGILTIKNTLLTLMQENLVIVNVWMEKKYKGYKYLGKGRRRKMYRFCDLIVAEFEKFVPVNPVSAPAYSGSPENKEKLLYLAKIMSFLKPGERYQYIRTASFGKLLVNPLEDKLKGDCNQIVTFYAYLYSLKYPLQDLNIKLLPEHVCLHFAGMDIEATTGAFADYHENKEVLPITEIISTNLLDVEDFREDLVEISDREMLKSAHLAYSISSLRPLVEQNLKAAYKNLAISAMNEGKFDSALFFASKLGDPNFILSVKRKRAVSAYEVGDFEKALGFFKQVGDRDGEQACYGKMYNQLAKKVDGIKTLDEARKYKSTYKKMVELARKIGDAEMEASVNEILRGL